MTQSISSTQFLSTSFNGPEGTSKLIKLKVGLMEEEKTAAAGLFGVMMGSAVYLAFGNLTAAFSAGIITRFTVSSIYELIHVQNMNDLVKASIPTNHPVARLF